jgi:hypothetical protein
MIAFYRRILFKNYATETIKNTKILAMERVGRAFKKGGIVKGKRGKAVPILAHAGELVVPASVVPHVLKSSAWMDHVKAVAKKQGAMKVAKGSYTPTKSRPAKKK